MNADWAKTPSSDGIAHQPLAASPLIFDRFASSITSSSAMQLSSPFTLPLNNSNRIGLTIAIWSHGPSTVHDVHTALNADPTAPKQLAYTTLLRNLVKRAFLDQKPEGRAHRFAPLITAAAYELMMVRQMREELFGGDVGRMMMRIGEDEEIEARKRERIQALTVFFIPRQPAP